MLRTMLDFWNDECGQGLVEYALLIAIVSIASIAGLKFLGTRANTMFHTMGVNV